MATRKFDPEAPFQSIRNTAFLTGLSAGFIRQGCQAGKIPHVRVGGEYRINVPLFLAQLDEASTNGGGNARLVLK